MMTIYSTTPMIFPPHAAKPFLTSHSPQSTTLNTLALTAFSFLSKQTSLNANFHFHAETLYDGLGKIKQKVQESIDYFYKLFDLTFILGKSPEHRGGRYNPNWRGSQSAATSLVYVNSTDEELQARENQEISLSEDQAPSEAAPLSSPHIFLKTVKEIPNPKDAAQYVLKAFQSKDVSTSRSRELSPALSILTEQILRVLHDKEASLPDLLSVALTGGNISEANNIWVSMDAKSRRSFVRSAAKLGHIQVFDFVQQSQQELLYTQDENKDNIAHYAAWNGQREVLNWIAAHRPNLLVASNVNKYNIAHFAAEGGSVEMLDWVLANRRHLLSATDMSGCNIAHVAARNGKKAALDWINDKFPDFFKATDLYGFDIFYCAAKWRNTDALDWILSNRADLITEEDDDGENAVHRAAANGHLAILDWIVNHEDPLIKALLSTKSYFGNNIAHNAVVNGQTKALDWILINQPKLFTEKSTSGEGVVMILTLVENKASLKWFANHLSNPVIRACFILAGIDPKAFRDSYR